MANAVSSAAQRVAELARAIAVVLEQVVSHALGGLRPHAGQYLERLDQRLQRGRWRSSHPQNGSLKPGGSGRPDVIEPIFSCEVASALRTASLNAAATRSSSRSLSSA